MAIIVGLLLLVMAALHIVGADAAAGEAVADVLHAGFFSGPVFWRLMGVVGLSASVLILRSVAE